jgi:DNA-binding HxlR family transcriptional regulator
VYLYGQYCPVARAAEILADRWTLLIVRELLADVDHFNALERGLPGISRPLLVERLRRLEQMGVVNRRSSGAGHRTEYRLTAAGRELQTVIDTLGQWGARWAFGEPRPSELDPLILLWWMRRRVEFDRLPRRRTVIRFDFTGQVSGSYWLVIEAADVSICLKDPGFDVDLIVTADIAAFYRVWLGRITFGEALRSETVRLDGMPADIRAFPRWFSWSPMVERVRGAIQAPRRSAAQARREPV